MKKNGRGSRKQGRAIVRPGPWLTALSLAAAIAMLAAVLLARPAAVAIPQAPQHYLEDRAGLLSAEFVASKNAYLDYLTRTQAIAHVNILILPRAAVPDLEDLTIRAATAWKIGASHMDNGLALFVFADERKLRLEVGYGLESSITDAQADRLLSEVVAPAFARGEYDAGIEEFLSAIVKTIESSEAAGQRGAPDDTIFDAALTALRHHPAVVRSAWATVVEGDTATRLAGALIASMLAALVVYPLSLIVSGVPAVVMLPWRVYASPTLRATKLSGLAHELSLGDSQHPPPFLVKLFDELRLEPIVLAFVAAALLVVAAAFSVTGYGVFMGGKGRFSGAGATVSWPQPAFPPGRVVR